MTRSDRPRPLRNWYGISGFVCVLLAVVPSLAPSYRLVAWPLLAAGFVLSIVGRARANTGRFGNRGLATAGIVLAVLGFVTGQMISHAVDQLNQSQNQQFQAVDGSLSRAQSALQTIPQAKHTVVFTLSTAQAVDVDYGEPGGEQSAVVSPTADWTRTQTVTTTIGPVSVLFSAKPANSGAATGGISCTIAVDGKQVDQKSSPTGVRCVANLNG